MRYTTVLLLAFSIALPCSAGAATVTWTGGGDGTTWEDADNWDTPAVPGVGDDVVINPVGAVTISLSTITEINSLTLDGSATLVVTAILGLNATSSIGPDAELQWGGLMGGTGPLNNAGTLTANGMFFSSIPFPVHNTGLLQVQSSLIIGNGSTNSGVIDIQIDRNIAGTFTNTGTLRKTVGVGMSQVHGLDNQGGTLDVQMGILEVQGTFHNTVVAVGSSCILRWRNLGTHILSGSLTGTNDGVVNLDGTVDVAASGAMFNILGPSFYVRASTIQGSGTLTNQGEFRFEQANNISLQTHLVNDGTITQGNGYLNIETGASVVNNGTFDVSLGINATAAPFGTFINAATGLLRYSTGFIAQIFVPVTNMGTIEVTDGELRFLGDLDHQAGAVMQGTGIVMLPSANLTMAGDVSPGLSPGILSIEGGFGYTMETDAVLDIEIGGTTLGTEYDQVVVNGTVTLGGTLRVNLLPSYVPSIGDTFVFMSTSLGVLGTFDTVAFPPGITFTQQANAMQLIYEVTGIHQLDLTANLAGPYNSGSMGTALNAAGLLPLIDPYGLGDSVPDFSGPRADVVDWVKVELRDDPQVPEANPARMEAALLKADGSIVDVDGTSPLLMAQVGSGDYHIVLSHRNHLRVASRDPQALGPDVIPHTYNFSTAGVQALGANAMTEIASGVWALWGGDDDGNGFITAFDFLNGWLPKNGGSPSYDPADFNLDAQFTAFDFLTVWLAANGQSAQMP